MTAALAEHSAPLFDALVLNQSLTRQPNVMSLRQKPNGPIIGSLLLMELFKFERAGWTLICLRTLMTVGTKFGRSRVNG